MSKSDETEAEAALERAGTLEESGNLEAAVAELSRVIVLGSASPRLLAHRGRLFHLLKNWELAISDFDAALESRPDASTTRFFRGRAKSMKGDLDGALADFRRCASQESGAADTFYEIGLIHEFRGELELSLSAFERAVASSEGDFRDVHERLAGLRARLGRPS